MQGAIRQLGFMFDFNSVTKYGFRPEVDSVMWWADGFGDIEYLIRDLLIRQPYQVQIDLLVLYLEWLHIMNLLQIW